jgi:hypothetical protein
MTTIHGNVKCDCGHKQKDHHQNTGYCHHSQHPESGKCGCTWFHPNVKYVRKKKIEQAKKRQLKLFI